MEVGEIYPGTAQRGRHCFVKLGHTESWGIRFFENAAAQIFQNKEAIQRLAENKDAAELFRFIQGALQHIAFAFPSERQGQALRQKLISLRVLMTEIYDQGSIRNFIFLDHNGIQLEAAWPKD